MHWGNLLRLSTYHQSIVLATFNESLLSSNHLFKYSRFLFISISMEIVQYKVVLSTYIIKLNFRVKTGKSFLYIKNSKGPKIDYL